MGSVNQHDGIGHDSVSMERIDRNDGSPDIDIFRYPEAPNGTQAESYRENGRVRKRTLANLSKLPAYH